MLKFLRFDNIYGMKLYKYSEYIIEKTNNNDKEMDIKVNINTAAAFIFNSEGKLLVCRPSNSNIWSVPKGQQDAGEKKIDTAKRELYEETNINMDSDNIIVHKVIKLPKYKYLKKNKTLVPYLFYCTFKSPPDLKCNSFFIDKKTGKEIPEMAEYAWVTLKEAKEILHEAQIRCLKENDKFFKLVMLLKINDKEEIV